MPPKSPAASNDLTVELEESLLRTLTETAPLAALLAHVGVDPASTLAAGISGRLDVAGVETLLGPLDDFATLSHSGGHPWAPVAAALTGDPDAHAVLLQVARSADHIGWLHYPKLAAGLIDNDLTTDGTRFELAAATNPFDQSEEVKALLADPPLTREALAGLIAAGRRLKSPARFVEPALAGSPDLDSDTALWLLEQLADDCETLSTKVAFDRFFDRPDLPSLIRRTAPAPGDGLDAAAEDRTAERFLVGLASLATAHDPHPHSCQVRSAGWQGLYYLLKDDRIEVTDDVYDAVVGLPYGPHVLTQRTDLPAPRYVELAETTLASAERMGLRSLAENPSCPDELLEHGPAELLGAPYLARLATLRYGNDPAAHLALIRLVADGRHAGLSGAALVELAAQTAR